MNKVIKLLLFLSFLFLTSTVSAKDAKSACKLDKNGVVKITQKDIKDLLISSKTKNNPLKDTNGKFVFPSIDILQQFVDFKDYCKSIPGKEPKPGDQFFTKYSSNGLDIDIPEKTIAMFENVHISNVHVGLIKRGKGTLIINNLVINNYGGDAINIRGSNVLVKKYTSSDNTPMKPYSILTVHKSIKSNKSKLLQVLHQIDEFIDPSDVIKLKFVASPEKDFFKSEASHVDTGIQAYEEIFINVCNEFNSKDRCIRSSIRPTRVVCKNHYLADRVYRRVKIDSGTIFEIANFYQKLNKNDRQISNVVDDILTSFYSNGYKKILSTEDPTLIESFEIYLDDETFEFEFEIGPDVYEYNFFSRNLNKQNPEKRFSNFSKESKCSIKNIIFPDFTVSTNHRISQIIALTDNNDFSNFQIGTKSLSVNSVYKEWFKASSLTKSKIGHCQSKKTLLDDCKPDISLNCDVDSMVKPKKTGPKISEYFFNNYELQGKGTTCSIRKISYLGGLGINIKEGIVPEYDKTCEVELWGIENKTFSGKLVRAELRLDENGNQEFDSHGKPAYRLKGIDGFSHVNDGRFEIEYKLLGKLYQKYRSNDPADKC